MNHITAILPEIFASPYKPSRDCPGYDHWLAEQVWGKAQVYFAGQCGPKCAEAILQAAGVACCEQNADGGPGWIGVI